MKVARRSLEKFGECAVGRMTEVDVSRGAVEDRGPARLNISLASIETPFTADLWPGEAILSVESGENEARMAEEDVWRTPVDDRRPEREGSDSFWNFGQPTAVPEVETRSFNFSESFENEDGENAMVKEDAAAVTGNGSASGPAWSSWFQNGCPEFKPEATLERISESDDCLQECTDEDAWHNRAETEPARASGGAQRKRARWKTVEKFSWSSGSAGQRLPPVETRNVARSGRMDAEARPNSRAQRRYGVGDGMHDNCKHRGVGDADRAAMLEAAVLKGKAVEARWEGGGGVGDGRKVGQVATNSGPNPKEEQAARQRRQKVARKARKVERGRELAVERAEQREGGDGERALSQARRAHEEEAGKAREGRLRRVARSQAWRQRRGGEGDTVELGVGEVVVSRGVCSPHVCTVSPSPSTVYAPFSSCAPAARSGRVPGGGDRKVAEREVEEEEEETELREEEAAVERKIVRAEKGREDCAQEEALCEGERERRGWRWGQTVWGKGLVTATEQRSRIRARLEENGAKRRQRRAAAAAAIEAATAAAAAVEKAAVVAAVEAAAAAAAQERRRRRRSAAPARQAPRTHGTRRTPTRRRRAPAEVVLDVTVVAVRRGRVGWWVKEGGWAGFVTLSLALAGRHRGVPPE